MRGMPRLRYFSSMVAVLGQAATQSKRWIFLSQVLPVFSYSPEVLDAVERPFAL